MTDPNPWEHLPDTYPIDWLDSFCPACNQPELFELINGTAKCDSCGEVFEESVWEQLPTIGVDGFFDLGE